MQYTRDTIKTANVLKDKYGRVSAPLFQRKFCLSQKRAADLVDFINKKGIYAK